MIDLESKGVVAVHNFDAIFLAFQPKSEMPTSSRLREGISKAFVRSTNSTAGQTVFVCEKT